MRTSSGQLKELLTNFKNERESQGISCEYLEEQLVIGPGWLSDIEENRVSISLEMFFALLAASNIDLSDLTQNLTAQNNQHTPRFIFAEKKNDDLIIRFKYAKFDAEYLLPNATVDQFYDVVKTLRDGLAELTSSSSENLESIKTAAVANAFYKAIDYWPTANPSDIWWFVIYRAYLDPFNHPSIYSRLSLEQSWKRTAGWALEEVLVRYYAPSLKKKGINLFIAPKDQRQTLLSQANVEHRLEADKADIFLTGDVDDGERFFGIIHVKASFAERRTDDVPMSKALVDAGYTSPLWTLDCKSTPSKHPINRGELGKTKPLEGKDPRSAKRKDIEDDGYFSACFSYNTNTFETPKKQVSASRVNVLDFSQTETDSFHEFICSEWDKFRSRK